MGLKALVVRHVAFEDLGTLAPELKAVGAEIAWIEAPTCDWQQVDPLAADLWVVLGGPIGVYETESYPFLTEEIRCLGQRLEADLPTLGICLGAQLMAAALGARVYPGRNGKEIGWSRLHAAGEVDAGHPLAPLLAAQLPVLHWHGDTFDLPAKACLWASSALYPNQVFAHGHRALGLQCHLEVAADNLENWLVGHACELTHAKVSPSELRRANQQHALALEAVARPFWRQWLRSALPELID